jgi:hypothetical protein
MAGALVAADASRSPKRRDWNFTDWKDHDSYQNSFEWLLRGLKAWA